MCQDSEAGETATFSEVEGHHGVRRAASVGGRGAVLRLESSAGFLEAFGRFEQGYSLH